VGSAYISPTYGYGLNWDASLWTVQEEFSENGEDWLALDSGTGFLSLGGYVYDGFGRSPATGCFQDRVAGLEGLPDVTSFVPAQAHQRPVTGGASLGAAGLFAATFSSESGEGGDQVIYYVECRVLGEGGAVLHLTVGAYADGYDAHRQAAEALLATLRLPGQAGTTTEKQAASALVPSGTPTVNSTSTPETSYASPIFGYTLTWAAPWKESPSQTTPGQDLLVLTNGVSTVRLDARAGFSGDAAR
jgi:hypothetical protein